MGLLRPAAAEQLPTDSGNAVRIALGPGDEAHEEAAEGVGGWKSVRPLAADAVVRSSWGHALMLPKFAGAARLRLRAA